MSRASDRRIRFRLFYGELHVGRVTLKGADFPTLFGDFEIHRALNEDRSPLVENVRVFITCSRKESEAAGSDDPRLEQDAAAFYEQHKAVVDEISVSSAWGLVDEVDGTREAILAPSFDDDGSLTWRLP